ncbi:MAG: hypothetical protein VX519_11260, partial [Myxococcota bacterium]|nr:hypothetical protein [Myxococcota bacterium]
MRTLFISCVSLFLACVPEPDPGFARAYVMNDLTDGVGGPNALARAGDFVLENDRVRFAFVGERMSFGPGKDGGGLIDADLARHDGRWNEGQGNDQFAELVSTANLFVPGVVSEQSAAGVGSVSILEDTGEAAVVRVSAPGTPFMDLVNPLVFTGGGKKPGWMVTDYILKPGEDWLTIRTTVTLAALELDPPIDGETLPPLTTAQSIVNQALLGGLAMGDFLHLGGSVDVFASDIGFHELGAVYDAQLEGQNLFIEPLAVDYVGGTAHGVSYGLAAVGGQMLMPLFAS